MPAIVIGLAGKPLAQVDHRRQGLVGGDLPAGPGPNVAHRHRAEAAAAAAVAGLHLHRHVQQHDVGHHAAAELDRRPETDGSVLEVTSQREISVGLGHQCTYISQSSILTGSEMPCRMDSMARRLR